MGDFAQILVAAGGGVALEGVDTAPQVANDVGITRRLLQQQGILIEGLENLLRTFEEDISKFVSAIVGKNAHRYPSILLYAVPLSW